MAPSNRLAGETSPYLRQHAENPVDWYPWGEEAFEAARTRDVPLLLSVGYSACHWCHVMAHESFEDPGTAALVNARTVPVKVDREERPDVDAVYMEAVMALTGQGGWPMTVFCTPDGKPFFGGTYFPPRPAHGLASFRQVLLAVDEAWRDRRQDVLEGADSISEAIRQRTTLVRQPPVGVAPGVQGGPTVGQGRTLLDTALRALQASFDDRWGGFGRAPKFPQPSMLELLVRLAADPRFSDGVSSAAPAHSGEPDHADGRGRSEQRARTPLEMLEVTLGAMAAGGIRDHLGGGFARYSTDRRWLVPHFEKMAYDQAGLGAVYLHAWQVTGNRTWLQMAEETLHYLTGELADPAGGFHSAEDADSEGREGAFYVWSPAQIKSVLGADLGKVACDWWGVTESGNFEGANILHRPFPGDLDVADDLVPARAALLAARSQRVRPGRDDKVLTEWTAMGLSTLAQAAMATGRQEWLRAAIRTGDFLAERPRTADGRWLRSWQDGDARHLAYAGDYAWLVDAFTRLGEACGQARWTALAREAADGLIELFADPEDGGFFTSGSDGERLIVRAKEAMDGATPSANSVAATALWRLGRLCGDQRYLSAADGALQCLGGLMDHVPTSAAWALGALHMRLGPPLEVVVVGDRPDLVAEVHRRFHLDAVVAWGEPYESPLWQDRQPGAAYVCSGYSCQLPATTPQQLASQLDSAIAP
ncbi:MAG: thioredoxin domain-containing protein [Actinomycetota bacterium]|nr:thioredoxin domain-containing protein [Actinomycetota bacterium]